MNCTQCDRKFKYKRSYQKHLEMEHSIVLSKANSNNISISPLIANISSESIEKQESYKCQYCNKTFARMYGLRRHIEDNSCKLYQVINLKSEILKEIQQELKISNDNNNNLVIEQLNKLSDKIDNIKPHNQTVNINNLNNYSINITTGSDYLNMLSDRMGFTDALEFVKDCALSGISGDVKLLMKVYCDGINDDQIPIRFHNEKCMRLSYIGDNGHVIKDANGEGLSIKLGENIQNTYLHGAQELNKYDPLPQYDMEAFITHTHSLRDPFVKKKILRQLMKIIGLWTSNEKWS